VRAGKIDLACFPFPINTTDTIVKPICPLDVIVISRRNHPAIERPLDVETFCQLPHIALSRESRGLANIDKGLVAKGMSRRVVYMAAKLWSIPAMVEATDLIGIIPRRFAQGLENNFALDIHEMPVPVDEQYAYIMWHVNSEHDAGHRWLRDSMMQAALSN
jgi:DNA-binding transcriptional LysR family regulator